MATIVFLGWCGIMAFAQPAPNQVTNAEIVKMLKAGVDKPEAVRRLAKADGNVRLAIEDTVLEL